jgi:hypothetical protein
MMLDWVESGAAGNFYSSLISPITKSQYFRQNIHGQLWQGVEDYDGLVGAGDNSFGDGD